MLRRAAGRLLLQQHMHLQQLQAATAAVVCGSSSASGALAAALLPPPGPPPDAAAWGRRPARRCASTAAAGGFAVADPRLIRNAAIIAHIDHGKTTLMDRLLQQCGALSSSSSPSSSAGPAGAAPSGASPHGEPHHQERALDSNDLERERGITILSKVTSLRYRGHVLNVVDTPGHADFGGEVERILGMVDGAVLLVDAVEGPLAQTKFVLAKALARGLAPIVVLNKVDRPAATPARCDAVAGAVFDLFASLGADDAQLEAATHVLYASGRQGWCGLEFSAGAAAPGGAPPQHAAAGMAPLLDALLERVPPPQVGAVDDPFALCVAMIERDAFVGRVATGRVAAGTVRVGDRVRVLRHPRLLGGGGGGGDDGTSESSSSSGESSSSSESSSSGSGSSGGGGGGPVVVDGLRVTRLEKRAGLGRVQLSSAVAGDIVLLAGAGDDAGIADTIAAPAVAQPLDPGHIDPPTLSMVFGANDSPLAGRAGKAATGRAIGARLQAEAEASVSLRVTPLRGGSTERYEVRARGEMQLAVVIESLRREGLEFAVSPPAVLLRRGPQGERLEPIEEVVVEVDAQHAGAVIEALTARRGELREVLPVAHAFQGGGGGGGGGDAGADADAAAGGGDSSSSGSSSSGSSSASAPTITAAASAAERQRLVFDVPSRGMLGFKSFLAGATRGEGLMTRAFSRYDAHRGPLVAGGGGSGRKGALVSTASGRVTAYALVDLLARGTFFVAPGDEVYAGQVVGEHNRDGDLDVNPTAAKKLTNVRSVTADEKLVLPPPRALNIEEAIGWAASGASGDELLEVTPAAVRLRKAVLDANQRRLAARAKKGMAE